MLDRIFKSEDGPGPVEYAVMLAILIALGLGMVGVSPKGGASTGGASTGGASRSVTTQESVPSPAVKVGQVQETSKTVQ